MTPSRRLIYFALSVSALLAQKPMSFMGRPVTIKVSESVPGDVIKRHASVCFEGLPRQCYSAPDYYFRHPKVETVHVRNNEQALLFAAETDGVSGFRTDFALLRPSVGIDLYPLLTVELMNQSQHAFWTDPSVSDAKIFATAEYVWRHGEAHYDLHRYVISSYLYRSEPLTALESYDLEDQFMTVRKYDYEKTDILGAEKEEITRRLKIATSHTR